VTERVLVRPAAAGGVLLTLEPGERRVIASLAGELREVLADRPHDPVIARLHPPVMPDDPLESAAFEDLVREDLDDGRIQALDTVARTIDAGSLDAAEAAAWLGVCNDLRLVLGTRLDVTEETELREVDEGDPDAWPLLVFHFLGWLVSSFVDVLAVGLPDVDDGWIAPG